MKNFFLLVIPGFLFFAACTEKEPVYLAAEGQTMGTYYRVTYLDSLQRDFSQPIDSLLKVVNNEISTYIPTSTISKFNQADSLLELGMFFGDYANCKADIGQCGKVKNLHFYANYVAAKVAHQRTSQAFDPTIMPLVNYWGFGYTPHKAVEKVDSVAIDSLLQFVGFDKIDILDKNGYAVIKKENPGIQLDFGGTGQGYGIDVVAEFLELFGIHNYLVDIGGECRARGKNASGGWWTIGVNTPKSEAELTDFTRVVELQNMSVSTSGNYRNFHELDGGKYSHFINPATGFPEKSTLLSVSVFGKDCLTPDALATGFMVMGLEKAYALASQLSDIEALFIYSDEKGDLQVKYTPGAAQFFVD